MLESCYLAANFVTCQSLLFSETDRALLIALDDKLSGPSLPSLSQITVAGSSLFQAIEIHESLAKTAGRDINVVYGEQAL